jgi:hypothetical protein
VSKVTIEQIEGKLKNFADLQKLLEAERGKAGGTLARHDWWRYHYYKYPYLAGAPDGRVAARFRDIFINLAELNSDGKIGIRPGHDDNDGLIQKFTHLLEEWNSRGGLPGDVVADARKPILKYFEHGDPTGVKLFSRFDPPSTPFLVKYSRREFLEPMLKKGIIRICPASYYADPKHIDAVRDSETLRHFFIPTFRERLEGKVSVKYDGRDVKFNDDDIVIPLLVPDYFLFCLCGRIYYRLPTDFDADAALIIRDKDIFCQRVISAFLAQHPEWVPFSGEITYYDPYLDYTKMTLPEMTKHFGYSYQREYRIAFKPTSHIKGPLAPEFITIGPMSGYAELLTL